MKIRVVMKDPDGYYEATNQAFGHNGDLGKVPETVSQWFKYNEYLKVEIDSETGEAIVIK